MSRDVCQHFNPIDLPCDQCDERGFPNALFLARELNAPIGTQSTHSTMQQAAAELRRLHALNAELVEALQLVLNNNECLIGERVARAALAKAGVGK